METDCYIAIKPCGCKVAWAADKPEYLPETMKSICEWLRNGYRIERAVTDEVRDQLGKCKCQLDLDL